MVLSLLLALLVIDARLLVAAPLDPQIALPSESEVLETLPPVEERPLEKDRTREGRPVENASTGPRTSGEWVDPPELPRRIEEPKLVVHKSKREIELLSRDQVVRRYRIALGLEPNKPKMRQGDFATPEGTYYICSKNPRSRYELALGLSYPGPADAERGLNAGLISARERDAILAAWSAKKRPPWNTKLGGEIMIHGSGSSWDWTEGCIALNYQDIEEIYRVVPLGTSVEIRP
jgi:hypothetical protein